MYFSVNLLDTQHTVGIKLKDGGNLGNGNIKARNTAERRVLSAIQSMPPPSTHLGGIQSPF